MPLVDPAHLPELPLRFMNDDHADEFRLIARVEEAMAAHGRGEGTLSAVIEELALLAVHTREHFLREEQAMRETGYPGYDVHKTEHDRVLVRMDAEARHFRERADGERLARYLFEEVPTWFLGHIRTVDTLTARYLSERRR